MIGFRETWRRAAKWNRWRDMTPAIFALVKRVAENPPPDRQPGWDGFCGYCANRLTNHLADCPVSQARAILAKLDGQDQSRPLSEAQAA